MRTRTTSLVLLALLAALVGLMTVSPVVAAITTLTATLEGGDAEDPPGDPDGSGTASITIDPATDEVCWDLTTTNIADAVVSHIHVGAAGANGGVVVPLDVDGFSGSSEGCVTDAAADLEAILANPAGFYVNVHTADYQAGAIRGQLATVSGPPNTALARPTGSPLVALGTLVLLIGFATVLRVVRARG
ncbi:MAG TPA: CHRD domain-containing protein [Candidatus Dormibacteraeota bacterium]|nr:CHRD domain-containing protein [Candidatus Dormibacteraeota bacterium]